MWLLRGQLISSDLPKLTPIWMAVGNWASIRYPRSGWNSVSGRSTLVSRRPWLAVSGIVYFYHMSRENDYLVYDIDLPLALLDSESRTSPVYAA